MNWINLPSRDGWACSQGAGKWSIVHLSLKLPCPSMICARLVKATSGQKTSLSPSHSSHRFSPPSLLNASTPHWYPYSQMQENKAALRTRKHKYLSLSLYRDRSWSRWSESDTYLCFKVKKVLFYKQAYCRLRKYIWHNVKNVIQYFFHKATQNWIMSVIENTLMSLMEWKRGYTEYIFDIYREAAWKNTFGYLYAYLVLLRGCVKNDYPCN